MAQEMKRKYTFFVTLAVIVGIVAIVFMILFLSLRSANKKFMKLVESDEMKKVRSIYFSAIDKQINESKSSAERTEFLMYSINVGPEQKERFTLTSLPFSILHTFCELIAQWCVPMKNKDHFIDIHNLIIRNYIIDESNRICISPNNLKDHSKDLNFLAKIGIKFFRKSALANNISFSQQFKSHIKPTDIGFSICIFNNILTLFVHRVKDGKFFSPLITQQYFENMDECVSNLTYFLKSNEDIDKSVDFNTANDLHKKLINA